MVKNEKIVLIVEYDVMMVDYFSDCFIVFEGELGKYGRVFLLMGMREGMNCFLVNIGIIFRCDFDIGRLRVNKEGLVKDRE